MKRFFLVLLLAAATFTITFAQDSTTHAKRKTGTAVKPAAKQNTAKQNTAKQLNLTKDQQAKIKASNKDFKEKSQKVKYDSSLTAIQKKAKIKELSKEKKKENDTVLTAEQKAKLKQIRKDRKAGSPQNTKPSPKTAGATKR